MKHTLSNKGVEIWNNLNEDLKSIKFLLLLLLKSLLSRVTTDVQLYKCQIPIY
jgi:hypothetical protein